MIETVRGDFRAMGTKVSIVAPADAAGRMLAGATERTRAVFEREEQRFSRFRVDSELSRVNGASGGWIEVSPAFERLARFALMQAERTGGLFDPAALDAVVAAGYDRDFDEVLAGARGALRPPRPCGRWREIEVRPGYVRLPAGVGLDLGGIAKGWTADLAAEDALLAGVPWIVVDAGGDLRVAGDAPAIDVALEDPMIATEEVARLRIGAGALASSSVTHRAWGPGLHHVVDPRTGAPADAPALQATAWAPTCAEAETLATWALLTGPPALDAVPGAIVTADGTLFLNLELVEEEAA